MFKAVLFGKALKTVRERRGITRKQLAKMVGCRYENVWFWEVGRHYPSGPMLIRLLTLFPELSQVVSEEVKKGGAKRKARR